MQSRLGSLTESVANVVVGFCVAFATQIVVFPLFGLKASIEGNLLIAGIFTVVSIARSYTMRRFFNWISR